MKRRFLTVLLTLITALCLAFGLAACGGNGGNGGDSGDLWTVERLYAEAQAKGFEGSLDDLIALFKGDKGERGVRIKSVEVDEEGHLKVTLTDGTVLDAGKVTADEPAEEGTEGLLYQKVKGEDGEYTAMVTGLGTAWDTDIVIPSTYRGLKVTAIGEYAFMPKNNGAPESNLTSVTISDTVVSIGESAFDCCVNLKSVKIGRGLTSIGERAFYLCGLEHISVSEGNKVYRSEQDCLIEIETKTLILGCKTSLIPDSVTSIGENAFCGCSGLTSVTIPDSVISIGDGAFFNCSGLTSVIIGDSVKSIGDGAFSSCYGLTGVYITDLAAWCRIDFADLFSNPLNYAQHLYVDNVELKELTIPDEITEIKAYAFDGCSGLTNVTIGSGVKSIGGWAFSDCNSLEKVIFMNPNGWARYYEDSSTPIETFTPEELSDPFSAAQALLRSTKWDWKRS